ncbi:uncharacterized protein EI97DRAFT_440192 [Westerdykella ornata]|uniref:Zn(2)-C6 fungal-type domain-containing protein n=1 Tax=Westerdykella ornata TaxID=318751 RepID=A0A6A6JPS5_WESOR|nr:uncharacterized protein EI97DRAFT_440192 [Westerdykella ornata]KAF2278650.1 hypothetical protein EI97DRAFT_440192 [Westerdykella ornata]
MSAKPTAQNNMALSAGNPAMDYALPSTESVSPTKQPSKRVSFKLHSPYKGRFPLRVNIYPHDSTEQIISTVKGFYGLYVQDGVVLEDTEGNSLIASYDNFTDNMTVHVCVINAAGSEYAQRRPVASKARAIGSLGSFGEPNGEAVLSDSDGGGVSVTSSRRGKKESVASADINVDNIVRHGRRKQANLFDSSELPLFEPAQVAMSTSSTASPQKMMHGQSAPSPYLFSSQQPHALQHNQRSPQSNGLNESALYTGLATPYTNSNSARTFRARARSSGQYGSAMNSGTCFPTPDNTNGGDTMSDEDLARQLIRLSEHGRTSTSTMGDAFSKADVSSDSDDDDDSSDDGRELPPLPYAAPHENGTDAEAEHRYARPSVEGHEDKHIDSLKDESDGIVKKYQKTMKGRQAVPTKSDKAARPRSLSKAKAKPSSVPNPPISPTSLPSMSRKPSTASLQFSPLAADEEDLSSKPRCQRCRKSKKGCDRQRPCQRCKDAGIGIEGCISEDEGNGRKGRYGRHMGVPVKKSNLDTDVSTGQEAISPTSMAAPQLPLTVVNDKNKKRKR